jgi:hypothetical protein
VTRQRSWRSSPSPTFTPLATAKRHDETAIERIASEVSDVASGFPIPGVSV